MPLKKKSSNQQIFLLYKFISFKIKTYLQAYFLVWRYYTHKINCLEKTVEKIKTYRKILKVNLSHLIREQNERKKIKFPKSNLPKI